MKSKLLFSVCLLGMTQGAFAMTLREKIAAAKKAEAKAAATAATEPQRPGATAKPSVEPQMPPKPVVETVKPQPAPQPSKGKKSVAAHAEDKSNVAIAGAAYIKLTDAGYDAALLAEAAKTAEAQELAALISQSEKSPILGRMGKPSKHSKRYSH